VFLSLFVPFVDRIARLGMVNSLSQLVLKIGSPGVPDFYQGAELWDLNLVDPDNRRAVDFGVRERWLNSMQPLLECECESTRKFEAIEDMLRHWYDGRIKLFCTAAGLRLRRRLPEVFIEGDYIPLAAQGSAAQNVVAFARAAGNRHALIVAPRLVAGLCGTHADLPTGSAIWQDTSITLPDQWANQCHRNVLTGEVVPVSSSGGILRLDEVLKLMPVALLENETEVSL
jgi:(1->4)-alpha-D-glucan 1-alpha-D-glucosylmutase